MRLLHTSDWHLGRSFHGVGMLEAQRTFADQLIRTVVNEQVDVVLIAGDVYDRALPGVDVVNLFDETLARLAAAGATVILTSGNHDSPARLGFASRILAHGGVHLRTRLSELHEPVVLDLGEADLAVYGIPYLEPRLTAEELGAAAPTHAEVLGRALDRIRANLDARRVSGRDVISVVLAHAFVGAGITSDSERDLAIGGVGSTPLDLFDGLDYVALGHLHGRQTLSPSVRYSGSPLPYSFSEARHQKGAWLVEIDAGGVRSVEPVDWPFGRRLAVLRGTIEDLLTAEDHAHAESAFCQITLTDAERPSRAMDRLRERFPDTLVLAFDPQGATPAVRSTYSARLAEAGGSDLDVCLGFLHHVRSRAADEVERDLLMEALESVTAAGAAR